MKLTVLIVDADAGNAALLAKALQTSRQIGTIMTASKPDAALEQAEKAEFILLDPLLPGMDGVTLLRKLAAKGLRPGVMVLSSFYSQELLRELDELGTAHCMYKPMDIDCLVRRIEQWHTDGGTRLGGKNLELERRISAMLLELGMTPISGFYDCRLALEWFIGHSNSRGRITKELYPYLARSTNQTARQVERNIRYAIEQTWLIGDPQVLERYFGYSVGPDRSRPSNAAFLRTLADHLRQSGCVPEARVPDDFTLSN